MAGCWDTGLSSSQGFSDAPSLAPSPTPTSSRSIGLGTRANPPCYLSACHPRARFTKKSKVRSQDVVSSVTNFFYPCNHCTYLLLHRTWFNYTNREEAIFDMIKTSWPLARLSGGRASFWNVFSFLHHLIRSIPDYSYQSSIMGGKLGLPHN